MTTEGEASRLPDPILIECVVEELKSIERRSGIDRTLAIGELILKRFFGGNPALWRDRRRNKNNSIRRLASRNDCPFCKSALNEAVAVYVAATGLPRVRTFGHISASHIASVLKLDEERRSVILELAEQEQWSVRELRQHVVSERRAQGERRGRPAMEAEARAVAQLKHLLGSLEKAAAGLVTLGPLAADSCSELRDALVSLGHIGTTLEGCANLRPNVVPTRVDAERRQTA